tara:strand:+ start:562 stop:696 length:135 start_codon:yes stop_codon:yes gene_type:complete
MRWQKRLKIVSLSIGAMFLAIQFVHVEQINPPVTGEIQAPEEVM